jgi:N-acetylglucosamine malate deacetylase 1
MDFLKNKNILVIGAHPDDEVLGVGGTIAKAVSQGSNVDVLIVTDGVSSQYQGHSEQSEIERRRESHLYQCCQLLGVRQVTQWDLPDMKLDTVPHIELNRKFEEFLADRSYDLVFVHHGGDINKDHQIVFESFMVAARPVPGCNIRTILTYSTPSSTEWGGYCSENVFLPNVYIDIADCLAQKLGALNSYKDELRDYPHPRSALNVENSASYYGSTVGQYAAEAFHLIRSLVS